ncbi:MAG: DNA-processing protein DprA [Paraprevotella sp.]|nr:DNA-processing protein DprA [Paraprevotella sp.]
MTDQEIIYTMALTRLPRINPTMQHRLLEELGSATALYEQRKHIGDLYPEATEKLSAALGEMERLTARAEEELTFAKDKQIRCLCYHYTDYPARLRECEDAPLILYYRGNADLNRAHVLNMVGTRHCTDYGKDICRHFLTDLKRLCPDALVVSGLAYGIDIHSHRAALDNDLDTVGVLAHGLDQIYPRMHRDTAVQMVSHGGLLTEFMSRTNADKVNFVRRNRIVAGMTDATIVVESAEKGGALITADLAVSYHRDVFAFPGRVNDPYSQGCNRLIRDSKAALLQNAQDFVEALGWQTAPAQIRKGDGVQGELFPHLCPEEQSIVDCLHRTESMHINALSVATNLPVHKLSAFLFNLELKGIVELKSGGTYRLC